MITKKHIKITDYNLEIKVSLLKMVHCLKEIHHTSLLHLTVCITHRDAPATEME